MRANDREGISIRANDHEGISIRAKHEQGNMPRRAEAQPERRVALAITRRAGDGVIEARTTHLLIPSPRLDSRVVRRLSRPLDVPSPMPRSPRCWRRACPTPRDL